MDIKKIGQLENLNPQSPQGGSKAPTGGPSFLDTLQKLQQPHLQPQTAPTSFQSADGLKFSNHAVERMRSRGVTLSPQDMSRLNEAVGKAQAKGSKDSLVLMNDSAFIVSVKNNTVVTVVDKASLKENVFTNIDSTIVM